MIKDPDPISAIIHGTTTDRCVNSLSRRFVSPLTFIKYITKPDSFIATGKLHALRIRTLQLRAAAIRSAYRNAGLTNLDNTAYLERHGMSIQAGDPSQVSGVGSCSLEIRALQTSPLSLVM